jgi:hypothetical protein
MRSKGVGFEDGASQRSNFCRSESAPYAKSATVGALAAGDGCASATASIQPKNSTHETMSRKNMALVPVASRSIIRQRSHH